MSQKIPKLLNKRLAQSEDYHFEWTSYHGWMFGLIIRNQDIDSRTVLSDPLIGETYIGSKYIINTKDRDLVETAVMDYLDHITSGYLEFVETDND